MLDRQIESPAALSTDAYRRARVRIHVDGIVQGVGFRPFVHSLATRLGLSGMVRNDARGVVIEIEGAPIRVDAFAAALQHEAPPLAVVEHIDSRVIAATGQRGFTIVESSADGTRSILIAPDIATCAACAAEIFDPGNRRYRYPFNNCTNCGPRFTIVRDVPYDRPFTTMSAFAMCANCSREYHDPSDRRFHAQPISCPDCGPKLFLKDRDGAVADGDPIRVTARLLRGGHIVAIKGIGGYHLACDATSESAVAALRSRKHREDKPFAIMVRDLDAARRLANLDAAEEQLLRSPQRPIVLLRRTPRRRPRELSRDA